MFEFGFRLREIWIVFEFEVRVTVKEDLDLGLGLGSLGGFGVRVCNGSWNLVLNGGKKWNGF